MTLDERIFQAEQESGQAIATQKLPSWAAKKGILYPVRLSMEQCSSEITAHYKAELIQRTTHCSTESFADLTGGFGVDCAQLAPLFQTSHYVEQKEELCQIAQHNFQVLGLSTEVHHSATEDFLNTLDATSCLFIDPARRSQSGSKVFKIEDCTPNIVDLHDALLNKTQWLLIKLSPMLDLKAALQAFPETAEAHIVSVKNECKELLLWVRGRVKESLPAPPCRIICSELNEQGTVYSCNFTFQEEVDAPVEWAQLVTKGKQVLKESLGNYLYEPGASLLKAGAFKWIAKNYGVKKLHPSSHLYVSDQLIENFPGKTFALEAILPVHKKQLNGLQKANLSIRNFPGSVAELRKKLGLQEGGDIHLFATTLLNEQKVLLQAKRLL